MDWLVFTNTPKFSCQVWEQADNFPDNYRAGGGEVMQALLVLFKFLFTFLFRMFCYLKKQRTEISPQQTNNLLGNLELNSANCRNMIFQFLTFKHENF